MQSALSQVEGVKNATATLPDKAEVVGTASTEALLAALTSAGYGGEVCESCHDTDVVGPAEVQ